jgi:hypothetical protein
MDVITLSVYQCGAVRTGSAPHPNRSRRRGWTRTARAFSQATVGVSVSECPTRPEHADAFHSGVSAEQPRRPWGLLTAGGRSQFHGTAFERSRWRGRRYACSLVEAFSGIGFRSRFRRGNLLSDAPYLECSQKSPVGNYFQWNIDSNSNNGPRLPQTPAASFNAPIESAPARIFRLCPRLTRRGTSD